MKSFRGKTNIVLIGMPGVGKSTLGVLLAKRLGCAFVDTDVMIQTRTGQRLHEIISARGIDHFKHLEEECIRELGARETVVATGGSVVYSPSAMESLKSDGCVLWLTLSYENLLKRLGDLDARGVVRGPGQSLLDLYVEREILYRRYADIRISCDDLSHEEVLEMVLDRLSG